MDALWFSLFVWTLDHSWGGYEPTCNPLFKCTQRIPNVLKMIIDTSSSIEKCGLFILSCSDPQTT